MSYILRQKCIKHNFGWGSAPDPAGGVYHAPPDPLTGFEGILLLREGKGMGGKGGLCPAFDYYPMVQLSNGASRLLFCPVPNNIQ